VDGNCSIIGMGVYRGAAESLRGIYFHADYCSGRVWGLVRDQDRGGDWVYQELLDTDLMVTGSGQGGDGELYLTACTCSHDRRYQPLLNPTGSLWRIVATDAVEADAVLAPTTVPEITPVAIGDSEERSATPGATPAA